MYVDEVGNPDLESSDNPNHRFLSLTGVIMSLEHVERAVHPELESLKAKYFKPHPDDPVVMHRKEMLHAKPPFEALRDINTRASFDLHLLHLLAAWEYTVITVCLDKKRHRETYSTWRYDPYHYCLALLLERFVFFLNRKRSLGDVMAESRGGKADMRLKESFRRLFRNGTDHVEPGQFQTALTSRELKVKPKSANVPGLQLADLVAHPSRCEILAERNLLGRSLASFAERIIKILQDKYDQRQGRVYGKKFI